ncbi:hypothetical protein BaRGS_00031210 [Batillaria attramentaria]|uniref:Uncharacterized protein n=1 Tax=Batillaria attramentaria TaxID=370345 RepID=A0ABD0JS63_9CAEN
MATKKGDKEGNEPKEDQGDNQDRKDREDYGDKEGFVGQNSRQSVLSLNRVFTYPLRHEEHHNYLPFEQKREAARSQDKPKTKQKKKMCDKNSCRLSSR